MKKKLETLQSIINYIDRLLENQNNFYDFYLMKSKRDDLNRFQTTLKQYRAILELDITRINKKIKRG